MRATGLPVILLVSGLLLVWAWPAFGVPATLMLLTLLFPVGRLWQVRASVFGVVGLATVAVLVDLAQMPVSPSTGRLVLTVLTALVVAAILRRRGAAPWPRIDVSTAIWALTVIVLGVLLAGPTWGKPLPQALSILWGGWDHSSHFAIFAELHQGQSVQFISTDATPVMFDGYPGLYAQIWALLTSVVLGGPGAVRRVDLLLPYIWLNAATAALACGALVVVASEIGRRMVPARPGGAAPAAGTVAALLCIVGGITQLSDLGHTNFLLAVAVAVLGGWFALSADLGRWPATGFFFLACLVVALLYPPMLAALGAAGLVLVWMLMPTGWASRALLIGVVSVLGLALLGVAGVDLRSLPDDMMTFARIGGGVAPLNAMMVVVAPVLVLSVFDRLSRSADWRLAVAAVGPTLGLGVVCALMVLAARASQTPITSSYYTVKMLGAVAVSATVLFAALLGAWFTDSRGADGPSDRSILRRWVSGVLAWAALVGVVVASAGYFGPKGSLLPAGSPLAPGGQALANRVGLVRDVAEGSMVLGAYNALSQGEGQVLMWDGGDLKNNRWVTAMVQPLTTGYDAFLSSLPLAPLDEQAVPIVAEWLRSDPARTLRVSYLREETRVYLDELARGFPGRVSVHPMTPAVEAP
jgi:hypothetical protein